MLGKFISEDDYKKAFGVAMDRYAEKAEEAGSTAAEIAMDGLMYALISAFMFEELFKDASDIDKLDIDL